MKRLYEKAKIKEVRGGGGCWAARVKKGTKRKIQSRCSESSFYFSL
jgi:hypothetical protein